MKIIFQRQLTGEALKCHTVAKRIRISADPSITYCPSHSGLAKREKSPQITVAKERTSFMSLIGEEVNFAEPKLVCC